MRRTIGVLQALRLALLQHMFIRAVSVPAFSRANDVSRDDVLEMVFTLRIDEALAQLRVPIPPASRRSPISSWTSRPTIRKARTTAMPRSGAISSTRSSRRTHCR
jgi:hypothetical protein